MSQRGDICAFRNRSTVGLAQARFPGFTVNPPAQLFFFARVRCTRAIRKRYFLMSNEEIAFANGPRASNTGEEKELCGWVYCKAWETSLCQAHRRTVTKSADVSPLRHSVRADS